LPQKIIINLIILIYSFVSHGYGLLVIQQMNRYSRRNLEHGEYQCFNSLQLNKDCKTSSGAKFFLFQLDFQVCQKTYSIKIEKYIGLVNTEL
jgi:hypothetical protein